MSQSGGDHQAPNCIHGSVQSQLNTLISFIKESNSITWYHWSTVIVAEPLIQVEHIQQHSILKTSLTPKIPWDQKLVDCCLNQHCLLWRDRAKSRRNVTSPSQRRVVSLWRIATLLLQWDKLVTVKKFYIHPALDTSDANNDLHDNDLHDNDLHVVFSFKSK
jgi:hypothetical protein